MPHTATGFFPIVLDVPVAWGEMDAFGHVNNIVFFRYFESARIAYLDAIGFRGLAHRGVGPILASTHCRFRRPLTYPDTVHVMARTTDIARDRFTMAYRIVSARLGEIAAEGGGVIVAYDYDAGVKSDLPADVRQRIHDLERRNGSASVEHRPTPAQLRSVPRATRPCAVAVPCRGHYAGFQHSTPERT